MTVKTPFVRVGESKVFLGGPAVRHFYERRLPVGSLVELLLLLSGIKLSTGATWVPNPLPLIKACCVLASAGWLAGITAVLLLAAAGSTLRSRPLSPGRSAQTLDATLALSLFALATSASAGRSELSAAFNTTMKRGQSSQDLQTSIVTSSLRGAFVSTINCIDVIFICSQQNNALPASASCCVSRGPTAKILTATQLLPPNLWTG